ncbi:hypothetical protein HYH03_010325 [Edaphochlamys debaryana]|uniref:Uncharacterized protein n=1 Tax=Edaphochlamys debaryana TaxID=47281 RepID=A0A836BXL7_9CHLO|nr:hypothetical protein HYH03_010325 [Edaphochlamys debaryana]|eukprot:KAG2491319.1 hypothetical protein HYH03_010325 [Edaphochlamys debaryana]
MRHSRRGLLAGLLAVSLLWLAPASTRAATECVAAFEATPAGRISLVNVQLTCTGDPVTFQVGGDWQNNLPPGSTGVATADPDPFGSFGSLKLSNAADVTFTRITLSYYDYATDNPAVLFDKCQRCVVQELVINNILQNFGSIAVEVTGSSNVTIQSAVISGMGGPWENSQAAVFPMTPNLLTVHNSPDAAATLTNAVIRDMVIDPASASIIVSEGAKLTLRNVTWQNVTITGTDEGALGHVVRVQDAGSRLEMEGCTAAEVARDLTDVLMPLTIALGGGTLAVRNSPLTPNLRPGSRDGGILELTNVSVVVTADTRMPYVHVQNAVASISDSTFGPVVVPSGLPLVDPWNGILLAARSGSNVTISRSRFDQISWSGGESQVLQAADAGTLLRVESSTFTGLGGTGTAVRVTDGAVLELSGARFVDIDTARFDNITGWQRRATVVVGSGGGITATSSEWRRINVGTSSSGAALTVGTGASASLLNCTFADINGQLGPAAQIISDNTSMPRQITISGCTWQNVTASPALRLGDMSGAAMVQDSQFTACKPKGALEAGACPGDLFTVTISNVTFTRNEGQAGGAMQAGSCNTDVQRSTFVSNTASSSGGAIFASQSGRGTTTLDACTFVANTASNTDPNTPTRGGAVDATQGTRLVVTGSSFTRNRALGASAVGGAITIVNATGILTGASFFANDAGLYGGAVYGEPARLEMRGCTVTNNAASIGGAVFLQDTVPASTQSTFTVPAVELLPVFGSPLTALPWDSIIEDTVFTQNQCAGSLDASDTRMYGGAVAAVARAMPWSLVVVRSTFTSNVCARGGAITTLTLNRTSIVDSTFRTNRARSGGAVVVSRDPSAAAERVPVLRLHNSTFVENSAPNLGGAFQAEAGCRMELFHNTFAANGDPDMPNLSGGAVFAEQCRNPPGEQDGTPGLAMAHNTFVDNTAASGGGLWVRRCNLVSYRDTFRRNSVSQEGGAVYTADLAPEPVTSLQLVELKAEDNFARLSGGAFMVIGEGITLVNSTLTRNRAIINGGGMSVLQASVVALKALGRSSVPYYTQAERDILRISVVNTMFTSNNVDEAGGALYLDNSELVVSNSDFVENMAGDGFTNDKWSDSGGAIFAVSCFALSRVLSSRFVRNVARGGPGGAIFETACQMELTSCTFDSNWGNNTGGGAVAAAHRRNATSNFQDTPNLVVRSSEFRNNSAFYSDGGAVLTQDINVTLFTSTFINNTAGNNGGAVALLSSLGSSLTACTFVDNAASAYGGGAYMDNTPYVIVESSHFTSNQATRAGGALSVSDCECVLTVDSHYTNNTGELRGGALHLQPHRTSSTSVDCVGRFNKQARAHMSPRGWELLGIKTQAVESYNATIFYDGSAYGDSISTGYFGRGGVQLPVPDVTGPGQIVYFDNIIVPDVGSTVRLAAGSSLPFARWGEMTVVGTAGATVMNNAAKGAALSFGPGVSMVLGPGSTISTLARGVASMPPNSILTVTQPTELATTALTSLLLGAGSRLLPTTGGQWDIPAWNQDMLWVSQAGSVLVNVSSGATTVMPAGTTVYPASGTPQHVFNTSEIALPAAANVTVQADAWVLPNGTRLTTAGASSPLAVTALPAAGSSVTWPAGVSISAWSWDAYALVLGASGSQLQLPGTPVVQPLPDGSSVTLEAQSVLTRVTGNMQAIPAGTKMQADKNEWTLVGPGFEATSVPGLSTVAQTLVPSQGSTLAFDAETALTVSAWNSFVIWSGPLGTLVYDTLGGATYDMDGTTTLTLARSSPMALHKDVALTASALSVAISGSTWSYDARTASTPAGTVIARSIVPAVQSRLVLANSTVLLSMTEWFRYLVWAGQNGTFLYDTATKESKRLDACTLELTPGSLMLEHDSATVVVPARTTFTTQGANWALANGSSLFERIDSSSSIQALLSPGSTISLGAGGQALAGRHMVWLSRNGTVLYDSALNLLTYRLPPGASLQLAAGSGVAVHTSITTVLPTESTLTVQGSSWTVSPSGGAARTFTVGGAVSQLVAAPAAFSRVLFINPASVSITAYQKFALFPGNDGTMLFDLAMSASYLLADGSVAQLTGNSTLTQRNQDLQTLPAGTDVTVSGGQWRLSSGVVLNPGNGMGTSSASEIKVHVPSITRVPSEIGRTCTADFRTAQYQANSYRYDFTVVAAYLATISADTWSTTNIAPELATVAYGYSSEATSGYNATLLFPGVPQGSWDNRGRPSSVVITCTASVAASDASPVRGLNMLHLNSSVEGNQATSMGGGIMIDGGEGRMLIDSMRVSGNSVLLGSGGGLALHQDDDQPNMQLQVLIVNATFEANSAAKGTGGGMWLVADNLHQEVLLLNSTLASNDARAGGGIAIFDHMSVQLNDTLLEGNAAVEVAGDATTVDPNLGDGGGILAVRCNELQITSGSRLVHNTASKRGGALSASACALLLLNETLLDGNRALSAGAAFLWNDLPLSDNLKTGVAHGASIAVVMRSVFTDNNATADGELEGYGGAVVTSGHQSTLLADSTFWANNASMQGGSVFIESSCDLQNGTYFRAQDASAPAAFAGTAARLGSTVQALQYPRPKGCFGTVVYLPHFQSNIAQRSGGALFASHPEALSLLCGTQDTGDGGVNLPIDFANFSDINLSGRVMTAMRNASFQLLNNTVVRECYPNDTDIGVPLIDFGSYLSTLRIANNSARGYGYLIGIVPSKLKVTNVSWTALQNGTKCANDNATDPDAVVNDGLPLIQGSVVDDTSVQSENGSLPLVASATIQLASSTAGARLFSNDTLATLDEKPFFYSFPGFVYDRDIRGNRMITNYSVTTVSNKPFDLTIQLLDALDQTATDNSDGIQAVVTARYVTTPWSNPCGAELHGSTEGNAYNGTAQMFGTRLYAVKGTNYTVELTVHNQFFNGTVESLILNMTVPPCRLGEVPREGGALCQECDPRSYSLWQDTEPLLMNSGVCTYPSLCDITCSPCPDGAECPGGAVIVPAKGAWQSAANSTFINLCPNPQACRDDDETAQQRLINCQEWWYSRPRGFDYQGFIDMIVAGNYDNNTCALWGLPYNHPASYTAKQCADGYGGNLCAVCQPVDGKLYAGKGDFECNECFSQGVSITIAVLGFVANVAMVLVQLILTFLADYTEDEDLVVSDILKVFIVHIQYFCIVTRLNIDWPKSISGFSSVYVPSCMLGVDASPAKRAQVDQLAAIVTPLVVTVVVALLWVGRYLLFNFRSITKGEQKGPVMDMRTIDEYKHDRALRIAAKTEALRRMEEDWDDDEYDEYYLDGDYGDVDQLTLQPKGTTATHHRTTPAYQAIASGHTPVYVHPTHPGAPALGPVRPSPGTMDRTLTKAAAAAAEGEESDLDDLPHIGLTMDESVRSRRTTADGTTARSRRATADGGAGVVVASDVAAAEAARAMPPPPKPPLPPPAAPTPPSLGDDDTPTPKSSNGAATGTGTDPGTPAGSRFPHDVESPFGRPGSNASSGRGVFGPKHLRLSNLAQELGRNQSSNGSGLQPTHSGGGTALQPAHSGGSGTHLSGFKEFPQSPKLRPAGSPARRPSNGGGAGIGGGVKSSGARSRMSFDEHTLPPPPGMGTGSAKASPRFGAAATGSHFHSSHQLDAPALPTIPSMRPVDTATLPAYKASAAALAAEEALHSGPLAGAGNGAGGSAAAAAAATMSGPLAASAYVRGSSNSLAAATMSRSGANPLIGGPSARARYASIRAASRQLSSRPQSSTLPAANSIARGGSKRQGSGKDLEQQEEGASGKGKLPGAYGSTLSAYNRLATMAGRVTQNIREFFTYDEDGVEEGEIRWASLVNIDRTMVWWRQELLVVMIAFFILYPAWAQATLQIFACYYLDDGSGPYPQYQLAQWNKGYWLMNMNQECYTGEHARVWVPLGVVCIFLVCLGIPLLTFTVLWVHRVALRTVHVVQTYGFLYRRYKSDRYWGWESVMQFQALLLVVVDVFGRVLAVYQQAVLLMIVLMIIMLSNSIFQPLKHKLLDRMSAMSVAVLSFTVALGLFFVPPSDRTDPITESIASAIGGIILALNLAVLAYFVYVMVAYGRESLQAGVDAASVRLKAARSRVSLGLHNVKDRVSNGARSAVRNMTVRRTPNGPLTIPAPPPAAPPAGSA